jgi:hypothetical protein
LLILLDLPQHVADVAGLLAPVVRASRGVSGLRRTLILSRGRVIDARVRRGRLILSPRKPPVPWHRAARCFVAFVGLSEDSLPLTTLLSLGVPGLAYPPADAVRGFEACQYSSEPLEEARLVRKLRRMCSEGPERRRAMRASREAARRFSVEQCLGLITSARK